MENETTESTATETEAVSNAGDAGDSDFEAALSEAGIDQEDLKGQGVSPEDLDGMKAQAAKQAKKTAKKDEDPKDLIQKLLDGQGDKAKEGDDTEASEEDAEQSEESDDVLEAINALELTHNGEKFKVGSKDELKALVQQGRDYTQKTQVLAQEKKDFEALKEKAYAEYNAAMTELNKATESYQQQLQQYQIWDLTLSNIKQEDPELFEDLVARSKQSSKYFENPVATAQYKALQKEIEELKGQNKAREQDLIRRQFDAEFGEQSTLLAQLDKELGLKVDREKIREEWIKSGAGVERAIGALYGVQIAKLRASKAKVSAVKAQVGKGGSAGAGRRSGGAGGKKFNVDWNADFDKVVNELGGIFG